MHLPLATWMNELNSHGWTLTNKSYVLHGIRTFLKNFIAFSGLDPSIHESGTFKGMSRLSKRGNRHLRRIIYLMTFCAIRIKGPLKTYFLKRRNEGLPFKKALFATAHKLIRTIFAMLTKRTNYVSEEMITG